MSARPDPETLLAHGGWIRSLARTLAADVHGAEDLVQDTWVSVLSGGGAVLDPRRFLAGVLRNRWRQERRSRLRRADRELRGARPEASESTLQGVERAATRRAVVEGVLALDEPYRTTVLLRYFEGLPPRAIASRCGVPLRTVNTRLHRSLGLLRSGLRSRLGDERAWLPGLLALVRAPGSSPYAATLAPWMLVNTKLLISAALVLAVGVAWWGARRVAPGAPLALTALEPSAPEGAPPQRAPLPGAGPQRRAVALAPESAAPAAASAAEPDARLVGRVVDPGGASLGGVPIRLAPLEGRRLAPRHRLRAESDASGRFSLPAPDVACTAWVAGDGLVTLRAGLHRPGDGAEVVVVAAPRVALAGWVVDEEGTALGGAHVLLELPEGSIRAGLADAPSPFWGVRTGPTGRFALPCLPRRAEASVVASMAGFEPARTPLPLHDQGELEIVLRRLPAPEDALRGHVVDRSNAPVPGARVALGWASTVTDSQGAFLLDRAEVSGASRLVAMLLGFQPGVCLAEERDGEPRWPEPLVVRIGGPTLELAGRVVDGAGQPQAELEVWIADPTPFGLIEKDEMAQAEFYLGLPSPADSAAWDERSDHAGTFFRSARTDRSGRFLLTGLCERSYRLCVQDPRDLHRVEVGPVQAGTSGLTIVFERGPERAELAGRVISTGGAPVPGVELELRRTKFSSRVALDGRVSHGSISALGPRVPSGVDGRFAFGPVQRADWTLLLYGSSILPTHRPIGVEEDPGQLEVRVEVRCDVEVFTGPELARADRVEVRDGDGGRLMTYVVYDEGNFMTSSSRSLEGGRSGVFSVSEGARTLVLLADGEELESTPIQPLPGELNRYEF